MSKNKHCFVPNCRSGYPEFRIQQNAERRIAVFSVPKAAEPFALWQKRLPRLDRVLTVNDAVCELHFDETFIERNIVRRNSSGEEEVIPRKRLRLKEGAIPSIFPNCPKYLSDKIRSRKPPQERKLCNKYSLLKKKKEIEIESETTSFNVTRNQQEQLVHADSPINITLNQQEQVHADSSIPLADIECQVCLETEVSSSNVDSPELQQPEFDPAMFFENLKNSQVTLPDLWISAYISKFECVRVFHTPSESAATFRSVQINRDLTVKVFLGLKTVSLTQFQQLKKLEDLTSFLTTVEELKTCPGSFSLREKIRKKCVGFANFDQLTCHVCNCVERKRKLIRKRYGQLKGAHRRLKKKMRYKNRLVVTTRLAFEKPHSTRTEIDLVNNYFAFNV